MCGWSCYMHLDSVCAAEPVCQLAPFLLRERMICGATTFNSMDLAWGHVQVLRFQREVVTIIFFGWPGKFLSHASFAGFAPRCVRPSSKINDVRNASELFSQFRPRRTPLVRLIVGGPNSRTLPIPPRICPPPSISLVENKIGTL